jgi:hypothetical protein
VGKPRRPADDPASCRLLLVVARDASCRLLLVVARLARTPRDRGVPGPRPDRGHHRFQLRLWVLRVLVLGHDCQHSSACFTPTNIPGTTIPIPQEGRPSSVPYLIKRHSLPVDARKKKKRLSQLVAAERLAFSQQISPLSLSFPGALPQATMTEAFGQTIAKVYLSPKAMPLTVCPLSRSSSRSRGHRRTCGDEWGCRSPPSPPALPFPSRPGGGSGCPSAARRSGS